MSLGNRKGGGGGGSAKRELRGGKVCKDEKKEERIHGYHRNEGKRQKKKGKGNEKIASIKKKGGETGGCSSAVEGL